MNGNEQTVWILDIFLDLNEGEIQLITFRQPDLQFDILFSHDVTAVTIDCASRSNFPVTNINWKQNELH